MQLEKRVLHLNETSVNSPVITNNPLQNISDPITETHLRTYINKVPQSANDNLIEQQPEETKPGSSSGSGDLNIVLRRSEQERRLSKY